MIKIKRRRLSSSITKSPHQEMQRWAVNNLARIVFGIIACIVWFGLVYFGCAFSVFLGVNIAQFWEPGEVMATDLFNAPVTGIVKIAGCIVIFIYVVMSTRKTKS